MLLDCVQDDDVAVQLVAALLVHEAAEELRLAELRRTLCQVLEETLIRCIKTLKHLLHSLAMKQTTGNSLSEMLLHSIQTDVSAEKTLVSLLQCQGVVPYETALSEHRVNLAVAPALIECVFVGHHSTSIQFVTITNLLKITDLYKHPGVKFLRFHLPPKVRGIPAYFS